MTYHTELCAVLPIAAVNNTPAKSVLKKTLRTVTLASPVMC